MPTYEYRCPDGHEFERFYRKFSDAAVELACPTCGKTGVRVVSGGAGLVFKGSGFYLTDYGKNAHRKGVGTGGKAEDKGGEGKPTDSPSKSETAPAAASDGAKPSPAASGDSKPAEDSKSKTAKPARAPKSDD
jgi:putative FmdB family regulatory protein